MPASKSYHTKNSTRNNYDRLSRWYDHLSFHTEQNLARNAIAKLDLRQEDIVLEIGCGTGTNLLQMATSVFSPGTIFGLDLSEGMLTQAMKKLRASSSKPGIQLIQGDSEFLPFLRECMHVVIMSFSLELYDDITIQSILAECWRILRPGGKICVVGLSLKPGRTISVKVYEWFHKHFPSRVDCRPILIEKAISSAGFHLVNAELLSLCGLPVEIITACR